jgi:hypothetical protein
MSSGLTIFLNYCIGKPGGEFSPYEIFSGYTVWLAKRRLQEVGLWKQYANQFDLEAINQKHSVYEARKDMDRIIYNAAEPFFTWERAFGMCSICTGFWVSLISGLFFTFDISELIEIIVISHTTIRVVNKLL